MNIRDFVSRDEYEMARGCAFSRKPFDIRKEVKVGKNKIDVHVDGRFVAEDLARDIWHGHDYLVGFSSNYSGKMGYGGFGGCTEKLGFLETWESFKEWFDKKMAGRYKDYEVEEYGQVSLF